MNSLKREKKRRMMAIVLSLVMIISSVVLPTEQVQAITQNEVVEKLGSLINQYKDTTATSSQMLMGSQCKGFANWVFNNLFGVYIGPYPGEANYKITNANAQLVGILEPGELTEESSKELLQKAKPGDYIQVQRSIAKSNGKCGPHSMIVVEVKNDGVQVFDCNTDLRNTIKTYLYTWSKFDYDNRAMSLYHANNYDATSSSSANKPGVSHIHCAAGTRYTPTSIWWTEASGAKSYDLKIWRNKLWEGDAYKILWNLTGTSTQVFLPDGYYEAYVDSRNGDLITMSENVVKFTVTQGKIVDVGSDFHAALLINHNWLGVTNTNGNADVRKDLGTASQIWNFKKQSDGSYTLKNVADGKYLTVDGTDKNGTNVCLKQYNGSDNQKFYIYGRWSGEYIIKPKCASRVVDVNGGKNNPGDNVQLWDLNYSTAQMYAIWKLKNPGKSTLTVNPGTSLTTTTLSWKKTEDTKRYEVKIWKNKAGQGNPIKETTTTDFSWKISLPEGIYEAYVNSKNEFSSTGSNTVRFEVKKGVCSHKYSAWTTTKKASCTSKGTEQRKCTLCGIVENREIKATGHSYSNQVIKPTNTQKGYTLHSCTKCGYSYKDNYVEYKKQLQSIRIAVKPQKTEYYLSEPINTTGLVVAAGYSDGTSKNVTGYTVSGDTKAVGTRKVTVSYTEGGITKTDTYSINVKEKVVKQATITYDCRGGLWYGSNQTAPVGSQVVIDKKTPITKIITITLDPNGGTASTKNANASLVFKGWYQQLDSNGNGVGKVFLAGDKYCLENDITLYAEYEEISINTSTFSKPSRVGYQFEGWYTPDGKKATTITTDSDMTLIAKWEKETADPDDLKENSICVNVMSDLIIYVQLIDSNGNKVACPGEKIQYFYGKDSKEMPSEGNYIPGTGIKVVDRTTSTNSSGRSYIILRADREADLQSIKASTIKYGTALNLGDIETHLLNASWKDSELVEDNPVEDQPNISDDSVAEQEPEFSDEEEMEDFWEDTEDDEDDWYEDDWDEDDWYEDDWDEDDWYEDDWDEDDRYEDEEEEELEVGDEIVTDYEIYTITKLGKTPTVEYTEMFDEDVQSITIPEVVQIDGVTYKVTSIAPNAFYKNTSLKMITIGSNVSSIGKKSFYGCKSLKKIIINSVKIDTKGFGTKSFAKISKTAKVYVPNKQYKVYKKALKKAGVGSKARILKVIIE